ncbi:MAG: BrnA antitoxin family protein [Patescibacteria group bacterium]|nr:BrnA antitoxin family protein [Patescibacteria group bacterium]MCL5431945.1 BrnA antitoxin family protein [Patescibacteria group bacterium]
MKKKSTIKKVKVDPIPDFKNREEEAEFWDTHSVVPYWNKWKKVKVEVAKDLS